MIEMFHTIMSFVVLLLALIMFAVTDAVANFYFYILAYFWR